MVENSDLLKEVLTNLINISTRKTNSTHAVYLMDSTLKNLQNKYDFLKNVEIKDTRFLENIEPVDVITNIDNVKSRDVGRAIYDIITKMNDSLGKDAGYFFLKEISSSIKDDYHSTMLDMGLDLGLMQLEREVKEMEKNLSQSKKDQS